ncbi:hypothetical protein GQ54DRAFT_331237 [Martensiomyces pterosporus]|nr:hypothetical protein GQ54DRAFT_331237 [Martensiomyces pterosporus]
MKSPARQQFGTPPEMHTEPERQPEGGGGSNNSPQPERHSLQQVLQWNEGRVGLWLRDHGFGKYETAFSENLINGEALIELDYTLLKELSVRTVGERVRLNLAIRKLRQQCFQEDVETDHQHHSSRLQTNSKGSVFAEPQGLSIIPVPAPGSGPVQAQSLSGSASISVSASSSAATANSAVGMLKSNSKDLPVLPQINTSAAVIGSTGSTSSSLLQGTTKSSARAYSAREVRNHRPLSNTSVASIRQASSIHENNPARGHQQQQQLLLQQQQQQLQQQMQQQLQQQMQQQLQQQMQQQLQQREQQPVQLKYRMENAVAPQLSSFTLKTGLSPKLQGQHLDAREVRNHRPLSNTSVASIRQASSIHENNPARGHQQQQQLLLQQQQQQLQQQMQQQLQQQMQQQLQQQMQQQLQQREQQPVQLKYRMENAVAPQLSSFTLKTGLSPKLQGQHLESAPLPSPRLRMLTSSHRLATIPPPSPQKQQYGSDSEEQKSLHSPLPADEIDRLGFPFQEIFGTDISVSNLADSLSLKIRQVSITGPDNQVRLVSVTNTRTAQEILDRILREFNLDTDVDKDRYSLFSMTSKSGGARCLTDEELLEIFSDPENMPQEKLFLRKRHQLTRPPTGTKRSEHLQRAIEKLGNIIPVQGLYNHSQQHSLSSNALSASSQTAVDSASTVMSNSSPFNPSPNSPQKHKLSPSAASSNANNGSSSASSKDSIDGKWTSNSSMSTEKLTRVLGERPPSELVSMNVEKYFPGNEARARYSIMRRRRRESQVGLSNPSLASMSRSSTIRQSKAHRRSGSSTRVAQAKIQSYAAASDNGWSQFAQQLPPKLEAIDEYMLAPSAPPLPPAGSSKSAPAAANSASANAGADADQQQGSKSTERNNKRLSKIYLDPAVEALRNASKEAMEFSDNDEDGEKPVGEDDDDYDGSLSDIPSSGFSSPFDSADSFYESLDDSVSSSDSEGHIDDIPEEEEEEDDNGVGADGAQAGDSSGQKSGSQVSSGSAGRQGGEGADPRASISAVGRASVASEIQQLGGDQTGTFSSIGSKRASNSASCQQGSSAPASERRSSMARSETMGSRSSRVHSKKKTWIKGAPIASGSFGSVYFGMHTRTGVIMAVKEVELPQPGSVPVGRKQRMADALRHELGLLQGLDHKNVVKYLGTDMDDDHLYIFLEYVSGGSVSSALASFGKFPESLVQTYTAQILDGLVYLHMQGIIHRDIKGGNVLIDQNGCVKISDFGISKRVDEAVAASKMNKRASLQGSVFWMAPEVVKDTKYTFKGDIWSLGCLIIEMMTGSHPFPELDQLQALYTIGQMGRPKVPSEISPAGKRFLEQVLELDLDRRPSASELCAHEFVLNASASSP